MSITGHDIECLLLAALLGAVIGMDREYRGKPAGFRTLILVSMGAALFSMISYKMALLDPGGNSDVTRIASSIITGIGFLGAGIIFRDGLDVKGLTTAATIWIAAAIGMAAGIGYFSLAIISTGITWVTLFMLHYLEQVLEDMSSTRVYRLTWDIEHGTEIESKEFFGGRSFDLKDARLSKKGSLITAEWTVRASRKTHADVLQRMVKDPRIVGLEH